MVSSPAVQTIPDPIVFPTGAPRPQRCAVAVGNFDGVHAGHAAIVARLRESAARHGVPAVVVTFDPHPATILRPDQAPVPLTTPARRADLLLALGLDLVWVQPTTAALMKVEAEAFYADVLRGRLGGVALVEGEDFRFGARRAGDVALLARICDRDQIDLDVVSPVTVDGSAVSSSRIRGLIESGRVAEANALSTAAYRLSGTVVHGAHRGAGLGFPTANLGEMATLVPGGGVYAARAQVDGEPYAAAVHIGPNATFGATAVSVEAHLIGFEGDCYGRVLDVDFLERLRDTRRFSSVDELKARLADDVASAARIAALHPLGTT